MTNDDRLYSRETKRESIIGRRPDFTVITGSGHEIVGGVGSIDGKVVVQRFGICKASSFSATSAPWRAVFTFLSMARIVPSLPI